MKLLITILLTTIFSIFPLFKLKKENNIKKFIVANKLCILFSLILFIGCFFRLYEIEKYPAGLNQDEASSGYEAFSLLNYGIDRNGFSYPVHFVSWGSGQNVLYSYLIMPLINIFDNVIISIRLPMALIGCFTLLMSYKFIKDNYYNKYGLTALFILAIIPWHIMKSRWGLESNLFPDIFLYGLISLFYGLKNNKIKYFIISSILFGISTYSYGTSYLFIPVFLLLLYIILLIQKKVSIKHIILYFSITGIIALPMIIFVIINYFNLKTIKILNITIPKLDYNRFTSVTSVNGNFIANSFNNLISSLKLIIFQNDKEVLNCTKEYGIYYKISLPFIIYGFIYSIKNLKNNYLNLLNLVWFITSIITSMMVEPNINRINCIWFSLIIYLIIGIVNISKHNKLFFKTITITYLVLFVFFVTYYFNGYQSTLKVLPKSLNKAIEYTSDKKYNKLYITNKVRQTYIYYLLYNKINPNFYVNNRIITDKKVMFQKITSIENIHFRTPTEIEDGNIYIFRTEYKIKYSNNCIEKKFNDFKVIDCTKK